MISPGWLLWSVGIPGLIGATTVGVQVKRYGTAINAIDQSNSSLQGRTQPWTRLSLARGFLSTATEPWYRVALLSAICLWAAVILGNYLVYPAWIWVPWAAITTSLGIWAIIRLIWVDRLQVISGRVASASPLVGLRFANRAHWWAAQLTDDDGELCEVVIAGEGLYRKGLTATPVGPLPLGTSITGRWDPRRSPVLTLTGRPVKRSSIFGGVPVPLQLYSTALFVWFPEVRQEVPHHLGLRIAISALVALGIVIGLAPAISQLWRRRTHRV